MQFKHLPAYASIILITALSGGPTALAQEALPVEQPYPRTRPVETDQLNSKPSEVPGSVPSLFSTVDAKKAADQQNQVALAAIQAAVDAELASAGKQATVATSAAAVKAWDKQVGVIGADLGLLRKALAQAEKALKDFKAGIGEKSPVAERAKIAGLLVKVASAKMYVEQYSYHYYDQSQMAATSRRVLAENRWFAAQAALKSVLARQNAMPYSSAFVVTAQQVEDAKKLVVATKAALDAGSGVASYMALRDKAAGLYNQYKAEHSGAVELVARIQRLLADKVKWDKAAADTKPAIVAAAKEVTDAEAAILLLKAPDVTGLQMAQARLKIAEARKKTGELKVLAFPLYTEAKTANLAVEAVVAPLTPALAQSFITGAESYAASVDKWIADSDAAVIEARALTKTATARQAAIVAAQKELTEANGAIEGLNRKLSEAWSAQAASQTALDGMRVTKNSPTEIAAAQAALTKAKADTAAAELALAQGNLRIASAKLALAQSITATEPVLLAVSKTQPADTTAAATSEKLTAEGEVTAREMGAESATLLNATAQARSKAIAQKTSEAEAARAEYLRLLKLGTAAQNAYTQSGKDLHANMAETPGPLTLINNRLRVGTALIAAQKLWADVTRQHAVWMRARLSLAQTQFATEAELSALSDSAGKPGNPGDSSAAAKASDSASAMWTAAAKRTEIAVGLGETFKTEMARLTGNLSGAKDAVTSAVTKVGKREGDIARVQGEYDQMLKDGKGAETLADKKVDLDGLKLDLVKAIVLQAKAELTVEEINLERDTFEALIDPRIASLYPFPRPDQRAADAEKVKTAKENLATKEREIPWAEQNLNYSLYMVDEIIINEQVLDEAEAARKKYESEVEESAAAKQAALEKSEGLLASAQESLSEIAARLLPQVFSDSRIDSYIQTRKVQKSALVVNNKDLAAARNKEINAKWATARTDLELARDSIKLAEATLDEARARAAIESARPDAKERDEAALALAEKEKADESLTAAHIAYEASYTELIAVLNEAVQVKGEYLVALENAGEKDGAVYVDIAKTIEDIKVDIEEAGKVKETVTANRIKREEAEAAAKAELEEAIANGWVRKEVPLNIIVKQTMKDLMKDSLCKKSDTDPVKCLVCNTIMEMRVDESMEGKLLPGRTVMIRYYKDLDFYSGGKNTVCGIVWKSNQYSWTRPAEAFKDRHILKEDIDEVRASLIAYYESEMPYPEPITHYLSPGAMTGSMPDWWYTCNNDMHYDIGENVACYDTSGRNYEFNETKYSKEARKRARSIKLSKESYELLLPAMPVARKRK